MLARVCLIITIHCTHWGYAPKFLFFFAIFIKKIPPKSMKNKNAKVKTVQIHWSNSRYNSLAQYYGAKRAKPQNVWYGSPPERPRHTPVTTSSLSVVPSLHHCVQLTVPTTNRFKYEGVCIQKPVLLRFSSSWLSVRYEKTLWGDPVHEEPTAVLASKRPSLVSIIQSNKQNMSAKLNVAPL